MQKTFEAMKKVLNHTEKLTKNEIETLKQNSSKYGPPKGPTGYRGKFEEELAGSKFGHANISNLLPKRTELARIMQEHNLMLVFSKAAHLQKHSFRVEKTGQVELSLSNKSLSVKTDEKNMRFDLDSLNNSVGRKGATLDAEGIGDKYRVRITGLEELEEEKLLRLFQEVARLIKIK